jgi:hypothetical protein
MHDVDESMNSFEFVQAKMSSANMAQNLDCIIETRFL